MEEYRIFGPPGTGKTHYLARQAAQAAEKYGGEQLCLMSFTNTGAREIKNRVHQISPLRCDHIGTIHSMCYKALDKPPIAEDNDGKALWNADHERWALTLNKKNTTDFYGKQPGGDGDYLLNQLSYYRNALIPQPEWRQEVQRFAKEWRDFKQSHGMIDFTDMVDIAYTTLERLPFDISVGMVDEAQDCSLLELAAIRKFAGAWNVLILAGDDDQAIFSWRGAEPEAFLNPPLDDAHTRVLSQSYRVPRAVHAYAEQFVTKIGMRQPKTYKPRDAPGEVRYLHSSIRDPNNLAWDITRQMGAGKTCMVLATCGYMLTKVTQSLLDNGVPFHNPFQRKNGAWNPLRRSNAKYYLLAFLGPSLDEGGRLTWTVSELQAWVKTTGAKTNLRKRAKIAIEALDPERDNPLVSMDELRTWFYPECLQEALGLDPAWWEHHVLDGVPGRKKYRYTRNVVQQHGADILADPNPKVILGTVHSVKGAQADCVYVFPDYSVAAHIAIEHTPRQGKDALRRVFYVAITRAREQLVICDPGSQYSMPL